MLTSFVTGTYAGINYDYEYDDQKRLIKETYGDFEDFKTVGYTYDKDGMLVERVRNLRVVMAGENESDLHYRTTYRYTYDKDGKLSGMTAETVDTDHDSRVLRESVLTVIK